MIEIVGADSVAAAANAIPTTPTLNVLPGDTVVVVGSQDSGTAPALALTAGTTATGSPQYVLNQANSTLIAASCAVYTITAGGTLAFTLSVTPTVASQLSYIWLRGADIQGIPDVGASGTTATVTAAQATQSATHMNLSVVHSTAAQASAAATGYTSLASTSTLCAQAYQQATANETPSAAWTNTAGSLVAYVLSVRPTDNPQSKRYTFSTKDVSALLWGSVAAASNGAWTGSAAVGNPGAGARYTATITVTTQQAAYLDDPLGVATTAGGWTSQGTFEQWGVPSGAVITQVRVGYDWKCSAATKLDSTGLNQIASRISINSDATAQSGANKTFTATTAYASVALTDNALAGTWKSTDTLGVYLKVQAKFSVTTGGPSILVDVDNIIVEITYNDPRPAQFPGTSRQIIVNPVYRT